MPDTERFGRTVEVGNDLFAIDLVDDPRELDEEKRGGPFNRWCDSLDHWEQRGPITLNRVAFGMDEDQLFDFLHDEDVNMELQEPFTTMVTDPDSAEEVPGLPYFNRPAKIGGDPSRRGAQRREPIRITYDQRSFDNFPNDFWKRTLCLHRRPKQGFHGENAR